jgi:tetraacyldisaccharide 4'-kinase
MRAIERAWYQGAWWLYLLLPLSWLFQLLSALRKARLKQQARQNPLSAPVLVIGNLTVGGTGKTPLILALAEEFKAKGLRVGIVSRGYGSTAEAFPMQISEEHDAELVGDEPLLLHKISGCPVVIDPQRRRACDYLLANNEVDIILSDDGLQHYALPRDIEIVVVDGERLFGNGFCLPAGPLRESTARLKSVDAIVVNTGSQLRDVSGVLATVSSAAELPPVHGMYLHPTMLRNLKTGETRPFAGAPFKMGDRVQAIAGIGNPKRFFDLVSDLPYPVECFPFPDHHPYSADDFASAGIDLSRPIVMTEKDGIKCEAFANENFWVLQAEVQLPEQLRNLISEMLSKLIGK